MDTLPEALQLLGLGIVIVIIVATLRAGRPSKRRSDEGQGQQDDE